MGKKKIKQLEAQVENLQSQLKEMATVIDSIAGIQQEISVKVLAALENPVETKAGLNTTNTEETPKKRRPRKTAEASTAKKETTVRQRRSKNAEKAEEKINAPKRRQKKSKEMPTEVNAEVTVIAEAPSAGKEAESPSVSEAVDVPEVKWANDIEAENNTEPQEEDENTSGMDSVVLYNCDEAKSPESMFNRGDEVFQDSNAGRSALLKKLNTEIEEGRIILLNDYPQEIMKVEILDGNYAPVNAHLRYGLIEKLARTEE